MKRNNSVMVLGLTLLLCSVVGTKAALAADAGAPDAAVKETKVTKRAAGKYATFKTNEGTFVVKLFAKQAPKTIENFVGLAKGTKEFKDVNTGQMTKRPFYNGLSFHRVIKDFMIQGGDPVGNGTGGPGYRFEDEFATGLVFDKPGILAMANAGPNTNGSQFFITVVPTPWLNNKHTIFGEVMEGYDVVDKIGKTPTGPGDRPITPIIVETLTIDDVK